MIIAYRVAGSGGFSVDTEVEALLTLLAWCCNGEALWRSGTFGAFGEGDAGTGVGTLGGVGDKLVGVGGTLVGVGGRLVGVGGTLGGVGGTLGGFGGTIGRVVCGDGVHAGTTGAGARCIFAILFLIISFFFSSSSSFCFLVAAAISFLRFSSKKHLI